MLDKFLEFKNYIYNFELYQQDAKTEKIISDKELTTFAHDTGMDAADFIQCRTEMRYGKKIQSDYEAGVAVGLQGTPQLVVNWNRIDNFNWTGALFKIFDTLLK